MHSDWLILSGVSVTLFTFVSVKTKCTEEGGRGPAAGDGEVGARTKPSHPRVEAHPQRGPVAFQQPSCAER